MRDTLKLSSALIFLLLGIVSYFVFYHYPWYVSSAALLTGCIIFLLLAMWTEKGERLLSFFRAAYKEALKVVWPSRRETVSATLVVFVFVFVATIYLWVVDKSLEWVLYSVVLGWKL